MIIIDKPHLAFVDGLITIKIFEKSNEIIGANIICLVLL